MRPTTLGHGDDEAFPAVVASARNLCPGKSLWLGPCTIAMRHNPYGADVAANPANVRLPAAGDDPRHGALFGAAFAVGVAAQVTAAGVDHLVLAAPTGRFPPQRAPAPLARFRRFMPSSRAQRAPKVL